MLNDEGQNLMKLFKMQVSTQTDKNKLRLKTLETRKNTILEKWVWSFETLNSTFNAK